MDASVEKKTYQEQVSATPAQTAEINRRLELLQQRKLSKEELGSQRETFKDKILTTAAFTQLFELGESNADSRIAELLEKYPDLIPESVIGSSDAVKFKESAFFKGEEEAVSEGEEGEETIEFSELQDAAQTLPELLEYLNTGQKLYEKVKEVVTDIAAGTGPEDLVAKYKKQNRLREVTGKNGAYNLLLAVVRALAVCPLIVLRKLKAKSSAPEEYQIVNLQISKKEGAEFRYGHVEIKYPEELLDLNKDIHDNIQILGQMRQADFADRLNPAHPSYDEALKNELTSYKFRSIYERLAKLKKDYPLLYELRSEYQELFFWLIKAHVDYAEYNKDHRLADFHINMIDQNKEMMLTEPYRSDSKYLETIEKSADWILTKGAPYPSTQKLPPEEIEKLPQSGLERFIELMKA